MSPWHPEQCLARGRDSVDMFWGENAFHTLTHLIRTKAEQGLYDYYPHYPWRDEVMQLA